MEYTAKPGPLADGESMTTDEVAKLFGIQPQSVGTALGRRGVKATHRLSGREGQNVYSAAAVRAVAPRLAVVDDQADADPISFARVDGRCGTSTTCTVVETIAGGVPPLPWARGEFTPTRIVGEFTNNHDGEGWLANVTVYGFRILKNGTAGADDARHYVIKLDNEPAWLAQWVADNRPTWEPVSGER